MPKCDQCNSPNGSIRNRGENFCDSCMDIEIKTKGINILVTDDRASVGSYVYNTVRDKDKILIWLPPEKRGIDGRDLFKKCRKRRKKRKVNR